MAMAPTNTRVVVAAEQVCLWERRVGMRGFMSVLLCPWMGELNSPALTGMRPGGPPGKKHSEFCLFVNKKIVHRPCCFPARGGA